MRNRARRVAVRRAPDIFTIMRWLPRIRRYTTGLACTIVPGLASAQTRITLNAFAEVRSALEAEGANVPPATDSSTRRCVDAAIAPPRFGDFTVRGLDRYANEWHRGGSKLMWFPAAPRSGDTLTVRVVNARRIDDSVRFRFGEAVRPRGGDALMHPSGVRIPRPGPWFFVARAGNNWGCFLYVLPDAS